MTKSPPPKRGGARKGAGRKPLSTAEPSVAFTIRLPASIAATLRTIGPDRVRASLERLARRKAP